MRLGVLTLLLLSASAAAAQVGLPAVRLPQVPGVTLPNLPAAGVPLDLDKSTAALAGEVDPRRLRELRALRLRELLRRHRDVLEADPHGAPIVRGEVLATQEVAGAQWERAILLLVFAYGGFEAPLIPAGEALRPQRDSAFALLVALPVIFAGIRTAAVQIVSAATLAAFIGGGGLGELITAGMGTLNIPQLVTGGLAVAALAVMTELGFALLERGVRRSVGTAA